MRISLQNSTITIGLLGAAAVGLCVAVSANSGPRIMRDPFQPPKRDPSLPPVRSPQDAAKALLAYVKQQIGAGDLLALGTKSLPSDFVAAAQRDMQLIASDGIYGPKTAARGSALLGVAFPKRPAPKLTVKALPATSTATTATSSTSSTIPSHAVEVVQSAPAQALDATPAPAPAPPPPKPKSKRRAAAAPPPPAAAEPAPEIAPAAPPPAAQRSTREAARALLNYVSPLIRSGRAAELGSKATPNDFVAAAQRDMRLIASDGIYGPKTAARGKELLGIEFPARFSTKRVAPLDVIMQPPPEPQYSPSQAAYALHTLVTSPPVHWGTRSNPNALIREAQRDMGGLTADGVYGPKTKARAEALTGQSFPPRG